MPKKATISELVGLAKAAAAEAANYQERFAAQDTEARKIVNIMEQFLKVKARVVYGGAAINAHLPNDKKFYDPTLYLPDYDFMTPDPLQDCADLIATFQHEGFHEVEAKFGIHEGTYKVFVNFRAAADVTYMPPEIYQRIMSDSKVIQSIHYASVNFLRMNMYLELSRPAGNVSRWEKVYERLLLLNETFPLKAGRCVDEPLETLAQDEKGEQLALTGRIIGLGIELGAVFLSGASYLVEPDKFPVQEEVIMMISNVAPTLVEKLVTTQGLKATAFEALGELLPARTELRSKRKLVAVVFETVACHSYTTLKFPEGYRLGSIDLLIQMYYAMYFADLKGYLPVRLLCVIQDLIDLESTRRDAAAHGNKEYDVFPMECLGHQPTMPELKKAHRERVVEKKKELVKALRMQESFVGRRRKKKRAIRNP